MKDTLDRAQLFALLRKQRREASASFRKGNFNAVGFLFRLALVAVFQLVTLPVEFNASHRAVEILSSSGMVSGEEERGVRSVLSAAALTYVAALATALANLLRLVLIAGRRNRD